ncbi:MAG: hypothetical protein IPN76_34065 [Saprospiraceae bacterium]|nr:hypothetical protein [Saprospiraceae bacterium]
MKKILLALNLLLSFYTIKGQNACEVNYIAFKKGVSIELTNYDKKGKINTVQRQEINSIEAIDGGFEAKTSMAFYDKKGKTISEGGYDMKCRNGVVYIDMTGMLDPKAMEAFKDMEMEAKGTALEFPLNLRPGMTLPDGDVNIKAKSSGLTLVNITMSITNRKVEKAETITTPAGTFDCIKVTQDVDLKSVIRKKYGMETWYALGVGVVKSHTLDKAGEIENTELLTKLEK